MILHQLALQAVVERCANNNTGAAGKIIPPNVLDQWFGSDRQHVDEVMQACRNVLRVVVDGLAPGGYLKHAPVRTFFRIVSVTLVLVKVSSSHKSLRIMLTSLLQTFAFGAFENEMALSLNLMDRTVQVMRNHVVDDVHLSNRFSNFLEVITNRLRPMIVRMSRTTGASSANAANSRVSSRPASPGSALQNRTTEHMPAFPTDGFSDSQAQQGNRDANANANAQALYGIPTQTYDISDGNNAFSIMPPPTEVFNHHQNPLSASDNAHDPQDFYNTYGDAGFVGADDGYDWLALPLDPILQAGGQDVTANCFGPGIGEFDMLEVLLGGGGGGQGQHGH